MENVIAAILFAVLVGAGSLGVTSLGMFAFHRNEDRDAQQRERLEYAFFWHLWSRCNADDVVRTLI